MEEKEIKTEIKRIEDKSEKFLFNFILLWGAIIFFSFRDVDKISSQLYQNFPSIWTFKGGANVAGYIFLLILILFFIFTIGNLIKNIHSTSLSYNKNKKLKSILKIKENAFRDGLRFGTWTSLSLILFLLYLLYIKDEKLIKLMDFIINGIAFLFILFTYILQPIKNLIENLQNFSRTKIKNILYNLISIPTGIFAILILCKFSIKFLPNWTIVLFTMFFFLIAIDLFKRGDINILEIEFYTNFFKPKIKKIRKKIKMEQRINITKKKDKKRKTTLEIELNDENRKVLLSTFLTLLLGIIDIKDLINTTMTDPIKIFAIVSPIVIINIAFPLFMIYITGKLLLKANFLKYRNTKFFNGLFEVFYDIGIFLTFCIVIIVGLLAIFTEMSVKGYMASETVGKIIAYIYMLVGVPLAFLLLYHYGRIIKNYINSKI